MRVAGRAARVSEPVRIKRFYEDVAVKPIEEGYGVLLDGRQSRTMGRNPLAAPTENLAAGIAAEWGAQGEFIDRQTMPLTAVLSAAIDSGEAGAAEWRAETLKFLMTDLLCYRATAPATLAERQQEIWDPYIGWLHHEFGAALVVTSGVTAVSQPDAAINQVEHALGELSPLALFAICTATKISGSAVLALALWKGAWPPAEIFAASRLDEHFQELSWGVDAEAKAREQSIEKDFLAVSNFMRLLNGA